MNNQKTLLLNYIELSYEIFVNLQFFIINLTSLVIK